MAERRSRAPAPAPGEEHAMAEKPTNSEFSAWLKEIQRSEDNREQKARDRRHKKMWEEMGSENEAFAATPKPSDDDRRVTG